MEPTRVELVWPGKTDAVERVALPFQIAETINRSRASREGLPMLAQGSAPLPALTDWTNKLIWGDNKPILASLIAGDPSIGLEPLAGKVDLIYIDPPFASGQDFSYQVRVGDETWEKRHNAVEETAYRDTWGRGMESYLPMMHERLTLARELMAPNATIWVHMDEHSGHYMQVILDEMFGTDSFLNDIIWHYPDNFQGNVNRYANNHNTIYVYGKTAGVQLNRQKTAMDSIKRRDKRVWDPELGRLVSARDSAGNIIYEEFSEKYLDDVWNIGQTSVVQSRTSEYLPYATQKPMRLLENVILSASNEGDLVLDFFAGSGTTLAVAEKLGRKWIGCDLSRYAIQVTRKRMLEIDECRPFQLLNLGRYERAYWQVNVLNGDKPPERAAAEYYRFIISLYRAEPAGGHRHLHGRKAGRMVHVGPADAPVTRDEIMDAVRECAANRLPGLDVLGWEWELGLHDVIVDEAKAEGVDVRLLIIPREVMDKRAVEKGDVRFHELAYLRTSLEVAGLQVVVKLDDFIIPNPELVPDEVRSRIKKWSDYIDFWAVDWNYGAAGEGDVFHNEWQTYRTRSAPALILLSEPHVYAEAGTRRILVKVIDIFGNDATKLHEVELR